MKNNLKLESGVKIMTEEHKELLKGVVDALNNARNYVRLSKNGVMFQVSNAEGKVVEKYFIKLRPVNDVDGIQDFEYVPRRQKD
jgi:hypothetical protein